MMTARFAILAIVAAIIAMVRGEDDIGLGLTEGSCYNADGHGITCGVDEESCLAGNANSTLPYQQFHWYEPGYISARGGCCHCCGGCNHTAEFGDECEASYGEDGECYAETMEPTASPSEPSSASHAVAGASAALLVCDALDHDLFENGYRRSASSSRVLSSFAMDDYSGVVGGRLVLKGSGAATPALKRVKDSKRKKAKKAKKSKKAKKEKRRRDEVSSDAERSGRRRKSRRRSRSHSSDESQSDDGNDDKQSKGLKELNKEPVASANDDNAEYDLGGQGKEGVERNDRNEDEEEEAADDNDSLAGLTPAQRRFELKQREREAERIKEMTRMTHRERVDAFNEKLSKLSEHHDIPKVSAAGNG
ncbi:Protein FAM32A [Hondaea fermentalgiana]|uniref:Protein FAM32A n=1 Tax=Hondaea fermentalgiana TaxID=2315210 RepID=A0A2R5GLX7_9STRA|nr:Protein FAM32A [Hondaea fermentalgiana]|eukprot:GBG28874.1 Protein FAM32A [Hondaea fermentalgiana]